MSNINERFADLSFDESLYEETEQPYITIEFTRVVNQTDKAVLFLINNNNVWLPKSQIVNLTENTVEIPLWLAEENNLLPNS